MRFILAILLFIFPTAVWADWQEIKTEHFLIYGNKSEDELRRFAERLEAVHYLMLVAVGRSEDRVPVRVKVYLYGDVKTVERLANQKNAAGFYQPSASGAIAVVPSKTNADYGLQPSEVLYHEYAHHFMLQYMPVAYPAWYVEGWAELFAPSSFERKGMITYGKANSDRQGELDYGTWTNVADIVSKPRRDLPKISAESFYGQAWLLTHYLTLSAERSPQLRAYIEAINRGASQADAAKAFGDLQQLNKGARDYLARRNFYFKEVPLPKGLAADAALRPLSASEIALMEDQIEFHRSMTPEEAKLFLAKLRTKVGNFGDDAFALQLLGEVEMDSENFDEARKIADRLVTIAPGSARAYWLKAKVEMHFAKEAENPSEAAEMVQTWISKANQADPDDPLPLVAFFDSYEITGKRPSKLAMQGLREAIYRVPQHDSFRFKYASALIKRGSPSELAEAVAILKSVAFDPHGGQSASAAQKMIDELMGKRQIENADDEEEETTTN